MNISIYGSGSWGTAIALLLHNNQHNITLWSKFEHKAAALSQTRQNHLLPDIKIPSQIQITADITQATATTTDVAIIATPSFAVRQMAESIRGHINPNCTVICMSKGIEKDTSKLMTTVLREALGPHIPIASVSGPTHAEEVARKVPSACVAASEDIATATYVQDLLISKYLRVYTTTDIIGVELGAALKNVIALGAGICDGLGFGDNTKAMLMTRGISEMARLCVKMGGKKETLAGLTGLGDLIVTCMSRHSRNRKAGELIGKGLAVDAAMAQVGAVVEGYYAANAACQLAKSVGVEMPICSEAYNVLYESKPPLSAMEDLMSRQRKSETDTGEETWVI